MDLKDKHVFVTGAGKRIGRLFAETFLKAGCRLTGHYFQSSAAVKELKGDRFFSVAADLRKVVQIQSAAQTSVAHFGPVDILVNCASDFYPTPTLQCSEEQWDDLLSVNLKGPFFLAQSLADGMQQRGGVILNIADVNGERAIKNHAPYSVSKAGLLHLTRILAKEWAPKIRVNSVSPGAVLFPEHYTDEQKARSVARTLFKRAGDPRDVVEAGLYLIRNDYVTGFDLKVDGGRSIV